jgi:two-component system response regulator YesN
LSYKVLIADDETIIREGLAKMLATDPELNIVAQAEDGELALEYAQVHLPDMLFVDIDMPFLNGLEFIEKLTDILSGAAIVIITGYDDFDYIQRALRLGVMDYLLKPVMEPVLFGVVERAKEKLAQTQKNIQYLKWAELQIGKNLPELKTAFFTRWLSGRYSEPEIAEQIEYLHIDIDMPCGITVAHISPEDPTAALEQGWDETLLFYAAENIANELFAPLAPVSSFKNESNHLVLLSACNPRDQWIEAGQKLSEMVKKHLAAQVELMQVDCANIEQLPEIFLTALEDFQANMKYSALVSEAKKYVDANFGDVDLSLQSVAERHHVSPEYLSRLYRSETGTTFIEYVTLTRIRKATELLLGSPLKIHEIAGQTGYSTQHYFSVVFKRVLGVTPAQYRKNYVKDGGGEH